MRSPTIYHVRRRIINLNDLISCSVESHDHSSTSLCVIHTTSAFVFSLLSSKDTHFTSGFMIDYFRVDKKKRTQL